VVEIVAYLKNNGKRGVFPFPSRRFISMATPKKFSIFGNEQKKKKTNRRKNYFLLLLFFFLLFLPFSTHTGLVSSLIMLAAVKSGDAKKVAELLIRQDPAWFQGEHGSWKWVQLIARSLLRRQ
jgi:hypothetical protein